MSQRFSVFAVYDVKAGSYHPPFYQINKGLAMRSFSDLVANPQSTLYRHPQDFALYELGTFDDVTGKFDVLDTPLHISNATEWVQKPE
ncbi:nonstructural protein [Apis mellifera associated microvirus 9]|nr:nonstructural protein [Apis mellifera associated microvirus 9]